MFAAAADGDESETMSKELKLDPSEVRECASLCGCRELATNGDSILSFMTGLDSPGDKEALARVNVYLETGTIGTCRVLNGELREIFRRNVTSIDILQRLFNDPPTLTSIDDTMVALDDGVQSPLGGGAIDEKAIGNKIALADMALHILIGEKEKLEAHLHSLEESDDESERDVAGVEFEFSLPSYVMPQVEQCLQNIQKMDKLVTCVATNGRGTIFLYGNGGVAFTPNIPKALYHKLKHMRSTSGGTRPSYVSLGTRDRYFVGFHDGTADWKGPKTLDRCLRKTINNASRQKGTHHSHPRSVAFGSSYDSFFVVFQDGSWEYEGRGIPEELEDKLADRSDRPDLVCVTLGPKGEWFLKAENGRMWWGGITEELDTLIQDLLQSEQYLDFMDFGEDGSYFVSYD